MGASEGTPTTTKKGKTTICDTRPSVFEIWLNIPVSDMERERCWLSGVLENNPAKSRSLAFSMALRKHSNWPRYVGAHAALMYIYIYNAYVHELLVGVKACAHPSNTIGGFRTFFSLLGSRTEWKNVNGCVHSPGGGGTMEYSC